MSKKLILTVGLPRSGKSTWAKSTGLPIVNPDAIRLSLHGQRFYVPAEAFVWAIAHLMVDALFCAGGETVIVDACNVTNKRRSEWIERHADAECEFKAIHTSPIICIDRAKSEGDDKIISVIEKMANDWDLYRPSDWPELGQ